MDELTEMVPLLEDIREVPVSLRRVLRNAVWVVTALSILALFGAIGFTHWLVAVFAVAAMCGGCWVDAARKLAYCRQWWKTGKNYSEWSF
jgi:hypothetical protein